MGTAGRSDGGTAGAGADGPAAEPAADPAAPRPLQLACAVLGLEALALVGLAVFLVYDTVSGAAHSVGGGLVAAVLVLACAAALVLGARGLLRCRAAARTPMVVLQVLAVPVSYSLGFQAGRIAVGGPMLVAALAVLYLLFTPPSRAALDRDM